jgi:carotenoid 1,2-hydratase
MASNFDLAVPANGYAWWYVDALSDDGKHGLTIIAFIGSVFSPYYAWARRQGPTEPLNHCAVNVALYGESGHRWAMTERGAGSVRRNASQLQIGPSALRWEEGRLLIDIEEVTAPLPSRIRGQVRLTPGAMIEHCVNLDGTGKHRWRPLAPCARVEVELSKPALRWTGHAYLDSNQGDEPLERAFTGWNWSRASLPDGSTAVLYEAQRLDGSSFLLAERFDAQGAITTITAPPTVALPASAWRLRRNTRADPDAPTSVRQRLEDGPFYARTVLDSRLLGQPVTAVHETLSLTRFASLGVQWMLPFRMPRRGAGAIKPAR